MSLSIEGIQGGAWVSGTTMALPGITTTGSSEPIVVLVARNGGNSTNSVASAHLTFSKRAGTAASNDIEEWTALASAPLTSEVITITFQSAVSYGEATAFGVLGTPATNYFDTNSSLPVVSTSSSTPTFSTTSPTTLVYGAVRASIGSPTPGAGWTAIWNPSGGFFVAQYQIFSAAQSGTSFPVSAGTPNGWIVDAMVAAASADVFLGAQCL